ncbi:hypothetical protein [Carboxylicivirga sp. RSCT41]|uniref:hypothetical protein n=1 Tax=Carboxylicivirga agarovorans TaxID=3417570 RepID=UPI003D32CF84
MKKHLLTTLTIAFACIGAYAQDISRIKAFEIVHESNLVDTTKKRLMLYPCIVKSNYMSVKKDQIWALAPKFDAYSFIIEDKDSPQLTTRLFYVNVRTGDFIVRKISSPINCDEKLLSYKQCLRDIEKQSE